MVLYPNPNNGEFTIQSSSKGIYILINELGQAMQVIQLNKAKNHTVNIGNLSAGVYFIVGCSNSEMTRQKVVVMKWEFVMLSLSKQRQISEKANLNLSLESFER